MKKILIALCFLALSLPVPARKAPGFKVGTYNLFTSGSRLKTIQKDTAVSTQRYWCHSAGAVGDMIVHLDCDIIGLQEVCDSIWNGPRNIRDIVAAKGADYRWILYPNTPQGYISYDDAIGYKPDVFDCLESGIFWLGGVLDRPETAPGIYKGWKRPAVWGRFRHKASGKEFYFISTHLLVPQKRPDGTFNDEGNEYNARQLRKWCEENLPEHVPAILVGDMNVDVNGRTWNTLAEVPFTDVKLLFMQEGKLSEDARMSGTQNAKDESRLTTWYPDHIMVRGFEPLDYVIDRSRFATDDGTLHYPSDHLPLTCHVAFSKHKSGCRHTPRKVK